MTWSLSGYSQQSQVDEEGRAMIVRLMGSLFAPKYPRFYTGRHRAPMRRFVPRQRPAESQA
ncbi:hypothetical protein GCM10010399_67790 [Dactylosporangium fulvum]|uniref:Uncharacterized protein n=1 Tax=Dactylosporangium fulvum TaxID=53359 RepID=A0ABY5VYJ2_9ACTN|nr:hypothetical protein [Dactylosporangium fulvum]UWP82837.1 hypothetical protein Dfulv_00510 [Dactylosporangium fulvum]